VSGPGRSASGTDHTCHATGCRVRVPPAMFACRSHWYRLPKAMRDAIWDAYVPGQEIRKDPSAAYLAAARAAISYLERIDERAGNGRDPG